MFYANFILKKRGPLSRIWLAAHWDKKLTKAHIFETDIEGSVTAILAPEMKLALRTSGHLLLGVVRIYSRKAKYLLADCNEALVKIKLAFRPGMVDLPTENREASLAAINIREDFTSFDLEVADFNDIDFHTRFSVNQSRPEDITLREDVACVEFVGDDGFDDSDKLGGPITIETIHLFLRELRSSNFKQLDDYFERVELLSQTRTPQKMTRYSSLADSGFGSPSVWLDSLSPAFGELNGSGDFGFNPVIGTIPEVNLDDMMFEHNVIQHEVEPPELPQEHERNGSKDKPDKINENGDQNQIVGAGYDECYYDAGAGGGDDDDDSISNGVGEGAEDHKLFSEENVFNQEEPLLYEDPKGGPTTRAKASENINEKNAFGDESHNVLDNRSKSVINELTTLIENDAEVFALGPVEVNFKERRAKRKRRLVVDEYKVISSETMKSQLSDSSELVIPLDLAPPTKKLMQWKESGGVEKLFILPGLVLVNTNLFNLFNRNLLTTPLDDLEDGDAVLEENSVEGNDRPPELKRDANVELSQSILSADGVDNVAPAEADTSASIDCSSSLPFEGTTRRKSRRLFGGDDDDPCPEKNLPDLPDFGAGVDYELVPKADGSPSRKLRKQSRDSGASDSGDSAENEDAIFDVEPAPTCSERANLRQELEETELEEILWGRRSTQMQHILRRKLDASDTIRFGQLTSRNNRKQVASKFYTILVLTKAQCIGVEQHQPYGDIEITKGPAFECII